MLVERHLNISTFSKVDKNFFFVNIYNPFTKEQQLTLAFKVDFETTGNHYAICFFDSESGTSVELREVEPSTTVLTLPNNSTLSPTQDFRKWSCDYNEFFYSPFALLMIEGENKANYMVTRNSSNRATYWINLDTGFCSHNNIPLHGTKFAFVKEWDLCASFTQDEISKIYTFKYQKIESQQSI